MHAKENDQRQACNINIVCWHSLEELWLSVRAASGAGGPDQWAGEEIRHLPECVQVFFQLTQGWERAVCRRSLRSLDKFAPRSKLKPRMGILALNTSGRSRSFLAGGVSTLLQWLELPARGVGARPSCALQSRMRMASAIQESLVEGGFVATLHWSQAYDCMNPGATMEAWRNLGFPASWVALLSDAWDQKRWVFYNGHVHQVPLVASAATPQGALWHQ